MARPSVVFINRVYPPYRGATGRVLRDLARAFARDGWKVTVVTTGKKNSIEQDGPIRVVRTKSSASPRDKSIIAYSWSWVKLLVTALRQPRADLVVSMTDPPLLVLAGRIVSAAKGSNHIHWCQDLYPDLLPHVGISLSPFWMRTLKRLTRKTMKTCDRVIVVGRCMARQLTHTGLDPRRITVIPNWPDQELTGEKIWAKKSSANSNDKAPAVSKPGAARPYEQLKKDTGGPKFRVLYSGNLGRAHPLQTILGAAQILHKTNPEIEFVFVGDGPSFERLAHARAHRGLDNIRLMPWQPPSRLREIMESGDVHLITMKHEVEGMIVPCKLYSALAVARPIVLIGPQDCETARVIRDFRAGDVVPQGNARRLAETIRRYRMNSDQWFAAFEGATKAGKVFMPKESIDAWLRRARDIVRPETPTRAERDAAAANQSSYAPPAHNKDAA